MHVKCGAVDGQRFHVGCLFFLVRMAFALSQRVDSLRESTRHEVLTEMRSHHRLRDSEGGWAGSRTAKARQRSITIASVLSPVQYAPPCTNISAGLPAAGWVLFGVGW